MTLPVNITLPLDPELIKKDDPEALYTYLRKLVYVLSTQMQQTNQTVNGVLTLISNLTTPAYKFITASGTKGGTTTYGSSVLWVRRSNLYTSVWFDITWAANTDTGNLQINSPYSSQPSQLLPYVGTIEPSGITFTAGYTYLTANILPGTNTIEIHQCGTGVPAIPLPTSATGHLRGSITYVGQQFS
ncbi:MAG: hypothetical protein V4509_01890 [Patescibacteria group bacterium]